MTGNWSTLLHRFYQNTKSDIHHWEFHLEALKEALNDSQEARDFTSLQLGIDRYEQQKVLRALAVWCQSPDDSISTDELVDLIDDIKVEVVNKVLEWADLLNLAIPVRKKNDPKEYWRVEPVVARILEAIGE